MAGIELDDEVLRPMLELAFVVAVVGARQRPPLPVPAPIKPYLRFQKLPSAALSPVRKALEEDEEFRSRAAAVGEESLVGRVGWLWLHRPDGWEDEAAGVVADEAAADEADEAHRQERSAVKRLDAAEQAARRATAELASVRSELAVEHRRRTEAEHAGARTERRVHALEEELGGLRKKLARAQTGTDDLDAARGQLAVREAELQAVQATLRALEEQRAAATVESVAPPLAPLVPPMPARAEPPSAPAATFDPVALAAALADAAAATRHVAAALTAATHALTPSPIAPLERAATRPPPPLAVVRRGRRRSAPLPGGVLSDSVEAAFHLVRVPGILAIVDGYNAAKLGWPDLVLAEQRTRLLDALDELVMRSGCDLTVVFDGADVASGPSGRRLQRVLFSPPGVSADEVIIDLVGATPVDRPVVVATTDRAVRDAVTAIGANVVTSAQLLAAIGRRA